MEFTEEQYNKLINELKDSKKRIDKLEKTVEKLKTTLTLEVKKLKEGQKNIKDELFWCVKSDAYYD